MHQPIQKTISGKINSELATTAPATEAKFMVPDWGEKVDSGGPVRQPYTIVDFIPQQGTMNMATGVLYNLYKQYI
jgi:hypothetical protein